MRDYYYAELTLRKEDFQNPEVTEAIEKETYNDLVIQGDIINNDTPLISLICYEACDGELEDLEKRLVELKVPFDRYSCNNVEQPTRYCEYRPDLESPRTTYLAADELEYIPVFELKEILLSENTDAEKLERIQQLADANSRLSVKLKDMV